MAPILAALIKFGLPVLAGAVASSGKELIQEKLGIDITDALGSEEGKIKLKELEYAHEEFLINAAATTDARELEYFKTEAAEKDSAREREIEIARVSGAPWWMPSTLTVLTFLVIGGSGYLFSQSMDENTRYFLVSIITMVLSYYYGTTRNSGAKDSVISSMIDRVRK